MMPTPLSTPVAAPDPWAGGEPRISSMDIGNMLEHFNEEMNGLDPNDQAGLEPRKSVVPGA